MVKPKSTLAVGIAVSAIFALLNPALAQFAVGQKVEFQPNQFQDKWEPGTVIKVYPPASNGWRQVVIRSDNPNPYNPELHDEVCYRVEHVRAAGAAAVPGAAAPAAQQPLVQGGQQPGNPYHVGQKVLFKPNQFQDKWEEGTITKVLPQAVNGLKQVVIRSTNPNPYNPEMHDEVAYNIEHVKPAEQGGVGQTAGRPIAPAAVPAQQTQTTRPAAQTPVGNAPNLLNTPKPGQPGGIEKLMGTWSTLQIGHTVNYAPGDGWIHQKQEIGAQAGYLTINPDHTFVWNSKTEGVIRGHWREATAPETYDGMGGASIRLLKGEGGWDYTVSQRPPGNGTVGPSIAISTTGYQVNGYKVK